MKDIKFIAVVVVLCLAIVFLVMDKCGSSRKVDELKGEYKEASEIAKVERLIKEEIIKEQKEEIGALNTTIEVKNTTIQDKDKDLVKIKGELGELKQDFESLKECQVQYNKLVKGFTLAEGIIKELGKPIEYYDEQGNKKFRYPEGTVTFSLNEKYEKQVIISGSYKSMYETLALNTKKLEEIVTAQDWQIKKIKLTSGIKTGIVLGLAGLVVYGVLK